MARKKEFPITTRVGATIIRIYKSPLHAKDEKGKRTTYDSFLVVYYRGGTRVRARCKSLELAQSEVDRVRTRLLNEALAALELTGEERLICARASERAKVLGIDLDTLTARYAEAPKILRDATLTEAAHFYDRFGRSVKATKTVPEVVKELTDSLRADNKSSYHIGDMQRRLKCLRRSFPNQSWKCKPKRSLSSFES